MPVAIITNYQREEIAFVDILKAHSANPEELPRVIGSNEAVEITPEAGEAQNTVRALRARGFVPERIRKGFTRFSPA